MVALRLAPVCVMPHDVSWSPILTAPEGATFATHMGKRLLMIVAPQQTLSMSSLEFGQHHDAVKHALASLLGGQQSVQVWLEVMQRLHPALEIAGMLIDQDVSTFFASNGSGVVMQRVGQTGLLCDSHVGHFSVSVGAIAAQDRFLISSSSLLATLQVTGWSFLADFSFDHSKRHIENAMQAKGAPWYVGALGEAIASHAAYEPQGVEHQHRPFWLTHAKQRLMPHYPRLKGPKHRVSKVSLSVGMLLLALLMVSIYLGSQQRLKRQKAEEFSAFVSPLEAQIAQAYAIRDANPLEAKRLVKISQELFEQGKTAYVLEPTYKPRLDALEKTLILATTEVIGISQATSLSPWHDLTLIKSGAQGSEVAFAGDQLFVLDQAGGFIYGIDVTSKEAQVVAGSPDLRGGTHLAAQGTRLVVVSRNRLLEISATQKTTAFLTSEDAGKSINATAFWLGNVYALDAGTPTIWKYPALSQGVGEAQAWLKDQRLVDTDAIDMAIDGDVWVLHEDGQIVRLRQGLRAGFSLEAMDMPLNSATHLAVALEDDLLFVHDATEHRIVEITKSGKLSRTYSLDSQLVVQDLTYSDATDELFILSGKELFLVPRN